MITTSTVPTHLIDPLGKILFQNPVTTPNGMVFERRHIIKWLGQSQSMCPVSSLPLTIKQLEPCPMMNELVQKYLDSEPMSWLHTGGYKRVGEMISTIFNGRSSEKNQLEEWISPGNVIAIVGHEGIGKTRLIYQVLDKLSLESRLDEFDNWIQHSFDALPRVDDAVCNIVSQVDDDISNDSSNDIFGIWTDEEERLKAKKPLIVLERLNLPLVLVSRLHLKTSSVNFPMLASYLRHVMIPPSMILKKRLFWVVSYHRIVVSCVEKYC
jgi:hypothetical protein